MHDHATRRQEDTRRDDLRAIYEATVDDVFGFLHLRTGGDRTLAEDLTAETFTAALRLVNEGRAEEVTLPWLRTVARRRLVDHWRRGAVANEKVVLLADRTASDPRDGVEMRQLVLEALGRLSTAQQQVLVLRHVDGHRVADVAALVGRSEKGVESLLVRARAAFREAYEEVSRG